MQQSFKKLRFGAAALLLAASLSASSDSGTFAQTPSNPTITAPTPSQTVIKALQEALNRQGLSVETTGIFDDATRDALRRFQVQHHLSATGEADRATLAKLGVADQPVPSTSTVGQASSSGTGTRARRRHEWNDERTHDAENDAGHDANDARNDGHDGERDAVEANEPRNDASGSHASDATTSDCPMMSGGQMSAPAMRQMMQGMMQMMRTMQNQMQSDQKSQGAQ